MNDQNQKRWLTTKLILCSLVVILSMTVPVHAQQPTATSQETPLTFLSQTDGLRIHWRAESTTVSAAGLMAAGPTLRYQGYELPMQLVTVAVQDEAALAMLRIEQVSAEVVAADAIQPAAPLLPPVIDPDGEFDLTSHETVALPTAPAFVLRAGMLDGTLVAILALSPIYQEHGETKVASEISVYAPGMQKLTDSARQTSAAFAASPAAAIPSIPPTNSASTKKSIKLLVTAPGMQRVPFSAITAAGLTTTGLGLTHNGKSIAIQIVNNELRFYAGPTLGDRWNSSEVYWLTNNNPSSPECQNANGCSMKTRSVAPASATSRTQAIEKGLWSQTPEYISRYAGPDEDHWFNSFMDLQTMPSISATINSLLPAVGGTSYSLHLTPLTRTDEERRCTLRLKSGAQTVDLNVNAMVSTSQGMVLKSTWSGTVTTTASVNPVSIQLLTTVVPKNPNNPPTPPACSLYFDNISWARTVSLNFNGKGVAFSGVEGTWHYKWSNLPQGHAFYDVSDPNRPVILTGYTATGAQAGFQDGPKALDYLMVGSNSFQTPQVIADSGFNFASITGAHAIYVIAPGFERLKNSRTLLEPLVTHRQTQGYQVAVIDVQDIYDAWNFGKVSPITIRTFLQYAATHWNPAPLAVVLVGDSTVDPKNLSPVPSDKNNNLNFIPPYMAQDIDPWLGEAACDNCYGQLNGTDAISGDALSNNGTFFDPDVWVGRFPVKSEQDLSAVVNKIVAYETTGSNADAWRRTSIFLADNYVRSTLNNTPVFDPAGNFAKDADTQISRLLSDNHAQRIYYDPYPQYSGAQPGETWRISKPADVMPKVVATASQGAGLLVYNGHSNHWNMGNLELDVLKNGVMTNENVANVLTLYDVDSFSNTNKYFIQLSMTCLTSQFVKPAASGTTIDERSFLNPNGGSIALWGPAGLSVAHGHDKLQTGFITKLGQNVNMSMSIGQLLDAGYQELLTKSSCCQDALQTFLLFGDPLTPARVFVPIEVFMPLINR